MLIDDSVHLVDGRIRKEYEVIADKALTTPTDTQQLMELKEFVEKAEEKDLVELEDRIALAWHRSGKNVFGVNYDTCRVIEWHCVVLCCV